MFKARDLRAQEFRHKFLKVQELPFGVRCGHLGLGSTGWSSEVLGTRHSGNYCVSEDPGIEFSVVFRFGN